VQLEFPWRDETALVHDLERRTGEPLEITMTDNTSTVMTYRPGRAGQPGKLRLHHMFLTASPRVVDALAKWISRGQCRRSGRVLDAFIEDNHHLIRGRRPRPRRLRTRGAHFDLGEVLDELNCRHFDGRVAAKISWGRMPSCRRRRSIRFGSFSEEDNLIRIHPFLDAAFVPEYFVRYIVFHEMLHADLGVGKTTSGRRRVHCAEFRRRERAYPDYARALAWQDNHGNLARLLRRRR